MTSAIPEEEQTAKIADYWFNLGTEAFRELGFRLRDTVSCLPNWN